MPNNIPTTTIKRQYTPTHAGRKTRFIAGFSLKLIVYGVMPAGRGCVRGEVQSMAG